MVFGFSIVGPAIENVFRDVSRGFPVKPPECCGVAASSQLCGVVLDRSSHPVAE